MKRPRARVTIVGDRAPLGLYRSVKHDLLLERPDEQLARAAADVVVVVAGAPLAPAREWLTLVRLHGAARIAILHLDQRRDAAERQTRAALSELGFDGDDAHVISATGDDDRSWAQAIDEIAAVHPRTGFLAVKRAQEWIVAKRDVDPPSETQRVKARALLERAQQDVAEARLVAARLNASLAQIYDRACMSTLVDVVWGEIPNEDQVCSALLDGEVPVMVQLREAQAGDPALIGLVEAKVVTTAKVTDAMAIKSRLPLPPLRVHVYGNGGGDTPGVVDGEWIRLDNPILFSAQRPRVALMPSAQIVDVEV